MIINKKIVIVTLLSLIVILQSYAGRTSSVSINVVSNPPGAYFTVNNSPNKSGPTPINYSFTPGTTYTLTFTKDGYHPLQMTYDTSKGNINVTLKPMTKKLTVKCNIKNVDVYLNNKKRGKAPFSAQLNPGNYTVQIRQPGYRVYSVTVNMNQDRVVNATLTPYRFVKINLPKGSRIWVDGKERKIKPGLNEIGVESTAPEHTVKIQYYELVIERKIQFNNSGTPLQLKLTL